MENFIEQSPSGNAFEKNPAPPQIYNSEKNELEKIRVDLLELKNAGDFHLQEVDVDNLPVNDLSFYQKIRQRAISEIEFMAQRKIAAAEEKAKDECLDPLTNSRCNFYGFLGNLIINEKGRQRREHEHRN